MNNEISLTILRELGCFTAVCYLRALSAMSMTSFSFHCEELYFTLMNNEISLTILRELGCFTAVCYLRALSAMSVTSFSFHCEELYFTLMNNEIGLTILRELGCFTAVCYLRALSAMSMTSFSFHCEELLYFVAVMRAVGIPTRSVTNFESAHDCDGSMTIDSHFDEDDNPVPELNDSVW